MSRTCGRTKHVRRPFYLSLLQAESSAACADHRSAIGLERTALCNTINGPPLLLCACHENCPFQCLWVGEWCTHGGQDEREPPIIDPGKSIRPHLATDVVASRNLEATMTVSCRPCLGIDTVPPVGKASISCRVSHCVNPTPPLLYLILLACTGSMEDDQICSNLHYVNYS